MNSISKADRNLWTMHDDPVGGGFQTRPAACDRKLGGFETRPYSLQRLKDHISKLKIKL